MLDASDIRGICAMPITPTREGGDRWDATDTVELDASAKMTDDLVQAGVGSFALCGTTGEGWGLSLDEKKAFIGTATEVLEGLHMLRSHTHADELTLVTIPYDHAARVRSYELIMEAM